MEDNDGGDDDEMSILEATVFRPALLLAYCRHVITMMPEQMPGAEPAIFESLAARIEQMINCRCAHCHIPEMAAVAFWWMAMHHDGMRELVKQCEPAQSIWRQQEFLSDLFAYAGAHILRIKNSPITPHTLAELAQVFYHSMRLVLQEPSEYTMALMRLDGAERTQKVPKKKKPRMRKQQQQRQAQLGITTNQGQTIAPVQAQTEKPLSPALRMHQLQQEAPLRYLAAGCRYTPRSKSKKAAAKPRALGASAKAKAAGVRARKKATMAPAETSAAVAEGYTNANAHANADDDDALDSDNDWLYMDSGEPF